MIIKNSHLSALIVDVGESLGGSPGKGSSDAGKSGKSSANFFGGGGYVLRNSFYSFLRKLYSP